MPRAPEGAPDVFALSPEPAGAEGAADLRGRLDALLALFGPVADHANHQPAFWMGAGDAGPDYCESCCETAVEAARASGEHSEAIVDGGWEPERENDGPAYCETCGCLLGYFLTEYGLKEEIEHWRNDADLNTLTVDCAYEVYAVLDAARYINANEHMADAVAIGERAAPLLPDLGRSRLAASATSVPVPGDGGEG